MKAPIKANGLRLKVFYAYGASHIEGVKQMEEKFDDWMKENSEVEIEEIRTPMPDDHYITIIVFYRRPSTSNPAYR